MIELKHIFFKMQNCIFDQTEKDAFALNHFDENIFQSNLRSVLGDKYFGEILKKSVKLYPDCTFPKFAFLQSLLFMQTL